MVVFLFVTAFIIFCGVNKGIESFSKILMPILLVLVVGIAIFSLTIHYTDEAGVEKSDGYIYFYGYIDNYVSGIKDLIVSRIHKNDLEDFSNLRYWNGTDWCDNIEESAVILENVSCEMSVNYVNDGPFAGKYLAVYTQRVESERIMYAVGDSPMGPFSEPVLAYTAPEYRDKLENGKSFYYTYNAKAHPHLSGDGSLLITYNVNVRDGDAFRTEDYIPIFLKLSWN